MNTENNQQTQQIPPPQYVYPPMYRQEDEIDLLGLMEGLVREWKWLAGITLAGTVLVVSVVMLLPKNYEASVQLSRPAKSLIEPINARGYKRYKDEELFETFYQQLRSPENFRIFLKKNKSRLQPFFSNKLENKTDDEIITDIYDDFKIEVVDPKPDKKGGVDGVPKIVRIEMPYSDQNVAVDLLNTYSLYTNDKVIQSIKNDGEKLKKFEQEVIKNKMAILRNAEKLKREMLISKKEDQTRTLGAQLDIILTKALDKRLDDSKLLKSLLWNEGVERLEKMEWTRGTKGTLGTKETRDGGRVETVFGTFPAMKIQLEYVRASKELSSLLERKTDDAYIAGLPSLLMRLDELDKMNFNFDTVSLFQWDKKAVVDNKVVKSKKILIVAIGFVLSGLMGVFVVLIMNTVKKREEAI